MAQSLSGRLLLLTITYISASAALIFLPAMGLKERELLNEHILSAELSILPFTTSGQDWPEDLRQNLLKRADADVVLLRRQYQRDFFQIGMAHSRIDRTIDLTHDLFWADIAHAMECLFRGRARTLLVKAPSRIKDAQEISIILSEAPIRAELMMYALRVGEAAAFISGLTGTLVFLSLFFVVVKPMRRITRAMGEFHENPEDARRILEASDRPDEIGVAERELAAMQRDLYSNLRQKARLAALGTAVSRIQHDLRNILANAQLASDRLAASGDPEVKRLAPRLMASLDRAIALATSTLKYGKSEDAPPRPTTFALRELIEEAANAEMDCRTDIAVAFDNKVDGAVMVHADRDQLFRIVLNLLRNACEALKRDPEKCETAFREGARPNEESGKGAVTVLALCEAGQLLIDIADNGPGIPEKVRDKLFQPFVSTARPGGSGLGLAIARDLARAHGGDLVLVCTGDSGTRFRIVLPEKA